MTTAHTKLDGIFFILKEKQDGADPRYFGAACNADAVDYISKCRLARRVL